MDSKPGMRQDAGVAKVNKIQKDGSQEAESKGDRTCTWTSRRTLGRMALSPLVMQWEWWV